jgi:hypothetical protein
LRSPLVASNVTVTGDAKGAVMLEYRDRSRGGRDRYAKLADRIVLARVIEDRGETNRSVASRARCHHSMISHLRGGRKRTCTVALASSIEEALGVRPGSLFTPAASNGC